MKSLKNYIQEKLIIKKSTTKKNKIANYNYFPETKKELRAIIIKRISQDGNEVDLNNINVLKITDMSGLFKETDFNGDISYWDVSNVTDMKDMFFYCKNFNKDISGWDVSNVTNMHGMFCNCESFNQDISSWDVSNVTDMNGIFYGCESFNQDISGWDFSNVTDMPYMFYDCESFNQDISGWDVSKVKHRGGMFENCPIEEKYKPKF